MQEVKMQEKVSVWIDITMVFPDDVDLSSKDKIIEATQKGDYYDINTDNVYWETEDHLEYDTNSIEKDGVLLPDEAQNNPLQNS